MTDSTIYGCTSADFTSRNGRPVPNAPYAAWTAEVGGEPVTGLLTLAGEPLTPQVSDDDGGLRFRDPRNGRDPIWIDTGWGRRIAVRPLTITGQSAYEAAVGAGFTGDIDEWLASLVGPEGDRGDTGPSGPMAALSPVVPVAVGAPGASISGGPGSQQLSISLPANGAAPVDWTGVKAGTWSARLREAFTSIGSSPLTIVAVGDSVTEGAEAGSLAAAWTAQLQAQLNTALGYPDQPTPAFIPIHKNSLAAPSVDALVTVTGGTRLTSYGLGRRCIYWPSGAAGTVAVFTLNAEFARIHYAVNAAGSFRFKVDSGAWTTVTYGTVTGEDKVTDPIPLGARDAHTLTIERLSGVVYLSGCEQWNAGAGVRVLDGGRGAMNADEYVTWSSARLGQIEAAVAPVLTTVLLGINDFYDYDADTFRARLTTIAAAFKARGMSTLFIAPFDIGTAGQMAANAAAISRVAAENDCGFLSLRDYLGIQPDAHPDADGHAVIGARLADMIHGVVRGPKPSLIPPAPAAVGQKLVSDASGVAKWAPDTSTGVALWLPGSSGHNISCPDPAINYAAVTELDVRWIGALADYSPSANQMLAAHAGGASDISWQMYVTSAGRLQFVASAAGTTTGGNYVDLNPGVFTDGRLVGFRALWRANGGSPTVALYYKVDDPDAAWIAITPLTLVGTIPATLHNSAGVLEIGSRFAGTNLPATGKQVAAEVLVNGATAASWRAAGTTSWRDAQGNVWTVNGAGSVFTSR